MLVENASNVLKQIQLYLEQLATALDLSVITYEMVLGADSTPQPLPQAIEDIQESLARLLEVLLGVHRLVVAAEQHRADISSAAEEVQRQAKDIAWSPSLIITIIITVIIIIIIITVIITVIITIIITVITIIIIIIVTQCSCVQFILLAGS